MANTPQTELDIKAAFHKKLDIAHSEVLSELDVAWPAIPYDPVQGRSYIRPSFFPATNGPMAVGEYAKNRATGFYQLAILTPATEGEGLAKNIIERLYPYFRRNTILSINSIKVRITGWQVVPMSGENSDWYSEVVRVTYRSDLNN